MILESINLNFSKLNMYSEEEYINKTFNDLRAEKPLAPIYSIEINPVSTWKKVVKLVLSIIIFPIGLYNVSQYLIGKIILPAGYNPTLMGQVGEELLKSKEWKFKRISISVDGDLVDVLIQTKDSRIENGKWLIHANGNAGYMEVVPSRLDVCSILEVNDSNGIYFNYPGVGASQSTLSKEKMINSYKAVLSFLEDSEKGLGAKEIIGYGFSLGGAVQAEALKDHNFKKDIKYSFIQDRTFHKLSRLVDTLLFRPLGSLIRFFGWELDATISHKDVVQTVIQTVDNQNNIFFDGVITANESLASFYKNLDPFNKNVYYEFTKAMHNESWVSKKFEQLKKSA